ncbi:MAG: DUF177 domain-containing protein [Elusimicrobia bacterium]|nr:DUF177 domain-containing protein [Elusimicrobiota bacterium]
MNDFFINPSELKDGLKIEKFIEKYSCKDLEEYTSDQKLSISFKAELFGEEVLVTGEIKGQIALKCFSCNEKFNYNIKTDIAQSFSSKTDLIDLEEEIRQLLILNLPNKPLCKENCLGLCPQCGKNLNIVKCGCQKQPSIDRWGKLKELLKNK